MQRITIHDHSHHLLMTWLWKEARRGKFAAAYALTWADARLAPDEYAAIGAVLDSLLRELDSPTKSKALAALARDVTCWLGLRDRPGDDPQRKALVDSLWLLSQRCGGGPPWDAAHEYHKLPGDIAGAATVLLGMGIPVEALRREPEILAQAAFIVIEAGRLAISITDVRDTLKEMIRFGPITDWVASEEVERLRFPMHQQLLSLLRSPDASESLRELIRRPGMADWLVAQMRTAAERDLLRTAVLAAHAQISNRSQGRH